MLSQEQFSAVLWKGVGAEGDFHGDTCKTSVRHLGLLCILCSINDPNYSGDKVRLIFPSCRLRSCTLQSYLEGRCFAMLFCSTVNSCPMCVHETYVCSFPSTVAFVTELLYRDRI